MKGLKIMCTCGIPNRANWYVNLIIGRPGETTYVDMYLCDEHCDDDSPESHLHPAVTAEGFEVFEASATHIR